MKHFFALSPHNIPYMNDVYNMVRKVHERPAGDPMEDLDVNVAIWCIFMNATLRAAIHLGKDHDVNVRNVKNYFWISVGEFFVDMEKLISGQTEIAGINLMDSKELRWLSTSLLHSRAYQYTNAKVYHRVALDWLFDRTNLDHNIQIRYINTKHQLAAFLTKGNFIRDAWNNLLHLCNISHFSSLCCAENFSLISCTKTMAKRMQEQKEDNRIVAKSKPTAVNLAVTVSTSSSSVSDPIAS